MGRGRGLHSKRAFLNLKDVLKANLNCLHPLLVVLWFLFQSTSYFFVLVFSQYVFLHCHLSLGHFPLHLHPKSKETPCTKLLLINMNITTVPFPHHGLVLADITTVIHSIQCNKLCRYNSDFISLVRLWQPGNIHLF